MYDGDKNKSKRNHHPLFKKLLDTDVKITKEFVAFCLKFLPLRSLKIHYKLLEVSCHGILWLSAWLAFTWFISEPSLYQMQVNMFIGLLIDIIVVAVLKAFTRRRRPSSKDDSLDFGPDKYGFPSGHASRAAFIIFFFMNLSPISIFFWPPLVAWGSAVCLSRLLMERHHLLDVLCGVLIGIIEGLFLALIWFEQEASVNLLSYITDEKVEGAEYHV